jgi:hypothetical protein
MAYHHIKYWKKTSKLKRHLLRESTHIKTCIIQSLYSLFLRFYSWIKILWRDVHRIFEKNLRVKLSRFQQPAVSSVLSVTSSFRRDADEIRALLGYNAASSGNLLPAFRDNVSVPSSRVKKSKNLNSLPLKMGLMPCPETSVRHYHSTLVVSLF